MNYPKGTRFVTEVDGRGRIVIETPPQKRTIFTAAKPYADNDEKYILEAGGYPIFLYFPYTIFIIGYVQSSSNRSNVFYNYLQVGFSAKPIENSDDVLFYLSLGNTSQSSFLVCLGEDFSSGFVPFDSLEEMVDKVIDAYWTTTFDFLKSAVELVALTKNNQFPTEPFYSYPFKNTIAQMSLTQLPANTPALKY